MEFRCVPSTGDDWLAGWSGDALAIGLFCDEEHPGRRQLRERFGAALDTHLGQRRFQAKPGDLVTIERLDQSPSLLILVGLGEAADFHLTALRQACGQVARRASQLGVRQLGLNFPVEGFGAAAAAAAMAEATRLSLYADQRFKSDPEPQRSSGARPPSTTTGAPLKNAEVIAETPFVTPGPAVSAARPGRRVSLA